MYRPLLTLLLSLGVARTSFAQDTAQPDITALIEAIRAEAGVPALGGALVTLEGEPEVWVTGTRRAGGTEKVTVDDVWHLGSCTKSMTATLLALMVERGQLSWDALLGDMLPDVGEDMDLEYTDVTLVELLCHRAGVPGSPKAALLAEARMKPNEYILGQRSTYAHAVLSNPPGHPPRTKFEYANDGFVVAGHVAEIATGKPWEALMQELLFQPLDMASAGFGAPGSAAKCDQPRGHREDGTPVEPGPLADNPPVIGPAGTVCASLADWAKYVQLHLRGARGDVKVGEITLSRDTFARLHSAYPGEGDPYGFGWVVQEHPWAGGDGTTLWHNGSNTMWYCATWLGLENGIGVLVTTNRYGAAARTATEQALQLLVAEHERRAKK